MKRRFHGGGFAALLIASTGAMAQQAMDPATANGAIAGRWYVSPMASMTFADNKRHT